MTPGLIAALIAAGAVVAAALITAIVGVATLFWRRMLRAESTNVALWTYTRLLVDHIYRGAPAPPPDPPDHIKHLYEPGDS